MKGKVKIKNFIFNLSIKFILPAFIIFTLSSCLNPTGADTKAQWEKTYGGSLDDRGYSVEQTTDGGYIIAGYTHSFDSDGTDVFLIKTDSRGNEKWYRTYLGEINDYGHSVRQTTDCGYIITGSYSSVSAGWHDVYLIKTDSIGNEEWSKTFGGGKAEHGLMIRITSDGGYIISGYTQSFGAGAKDIYLIKTDASGNEEWSKTFGGSDDDVGNSIQEISSGGFIIVGYTYSFNGDDSDVYLIKTDSMGNEIWSKTFGGSNDDSGHAIRESSAGGFIIAGTKDNDIYFLKTDSLGNEEISKTYGGTLMDYGYSLEETSDRGYIVVGCTSSFGEGSYDVYLIKIN